MLPGKWVSKRCSGDIIVPLKAPDLAKAPLKVITLKTVDSKRLAKESLSKVPIAYVTGLIVQEVVKAQGAEPSVFYRRLM